MSGDVLAALSPTIRFSQIFGAAQYYFDGTVFKPSIFLKIFSYIWFGINLAVDGFVVVAKLSTFDRNPLKGLTWVFSLVGFVTNRYGSLLVASCYSETICRTLNKFALLPLDKNQVRFLFRFNIGLCLSLEFVASFAAIVESLYFSKVYGTSNIEIAIKTLSFFATINISLALAAQFTVYVVSVGLAYASINKHLGKSETSSKSEYLLSLKKFINADLVAKDISETLTSPYCILHVSTAPALVAEVVYASVFSPSRIISIAWVSFFASQLTPTVSAAIFTKYKVRRSRHREKNK